MPSGDLWTGDSYDLRVDRGGPGVSRWIYIPQKSHIQSLGDPKKWDILRSCPDVLVPKKLGAFVKKH